MARRAKGGGGRAEEGGDGHRPEFPFETLALLHVRDKEELLLRIEKNLEARDSITVALPRSPAPVYSSTRTP